MKNLYQLYIENGNMAGFKVRRSGWANSSWARVVSITAERQTNGSLPGSPPYHQNAVVYLDFKDKGVSEEAPCPGTYQWELISVDGN